MFGTNLKIKSLAVLRKERKAKDDKIKWLKDQAERQSAASKTAASPKGKKGRQKKGGKKKRSNKKKQDKAETGEQEPQITLSFDNLGVGLDVDIDPDADIQHLWDVLNVFDAEKFDGAEKETLKLIRKEVRVCMPRELGDWITIQVNGLEKTVRCNCNRCNFDGRCRFVSGFESLQFRKVPNNLLGGESLNWNDKVAKAIDNAHTIIEELAKE